ncbi:MAG: hypothetical protein ABII22_00110 [Candidatus Micrarchaeota archaeon]
MGFLDSLFGKGQKEMKEMQRERPKGDVSSIKTTFQFTPLRLTAMKINSITLTTKVKNEGESKQLVSMDFVLPKNEIIGFDQTCLQKVRENKVGEIKPGETKEFSVQIYGSNQTKSCTCDIGVVTYSHYLDYNKVITSTKKKFQLRIS